jgi:hypothetical protein
MRLSSESSSAMGLFPEIQGFQNLIDVFAKHSVRSIPLGVNRALVNWAQGHWNLKLFTGVPSPAEVLSMQTQGARCVSIIVDEIGLGRYVNADHDPLGFCLHDLIHGDHFFQNPVVASGQVGFSRSLQKAIGSGIFHAAQHLLRAIAFCRRSQNSAETAQRHPTAGAEKK